jgi:hypothetical protein
MKKYLFGAAALLPAMYDSPSRAADNVLQRGYDANVSGALLTETALKPSNVSSSTFGRQFSMPVRGRIYAQPLFARLTMGGQTQNILFVATMENALYAFYADAPARPIWAVDYSAVTPGAAPAPITDFVGSNSYNIAGPIGIESTPVIDPATSTIYFVTNTRDADHITFRIHAVDATTGAERSGSPQIITGSYNGTTFNPATQNQRTSLTIANKGGAGHVIVAFGSHEDNDVYSGWVMAYNKSTLAQTGVINVATSITSTSGWTGTKSAGAIWQSGRPPVVDTDGYVYLFTGNGPSWSPSSLADRQKTADGVYNFCESVIKLDPSQALKIVDYFTPSNYVDLDSDDVDVSSSGPLLIPGSNVLIGGGKEGWMYTLDRTNLGHKVSSNPGFSVSGNNFRGGPVVWNRTAAGGGPLVYTWNASDNLKAFWFNRSANTLSSAAAATYSAGPNLYPGGTLTLSANGDSDGIIWALVNSQGDADHRAPPGELHAFNAATLTELWNSTQVPARDDLGLLAKYVPPLVANGKVYVATGSNQVVVYGSLASWPSYWPLVTAWPPRQTALGGTATYHLSAMTASGSPNTSVTSWDLSLADLALPGITASFSQKSGSTTDLTISVGANAPAGEYRLMAAASVGGAGWGQSILLTVPDAATAATPSSATADSAQSGYAASNAIDGNPSTYWHTQWSPSSPGLPHNITLDLGSTKVVSGLKYTPRQDGCPNGTIMKYEIKLSADNSNWTEAAGGSFDYGPSWRNMGVCNSSPVPLPQSISFPPKAARYVQLTAESALIDGTVWASAGEVQVYTASGAILRQPSILTARFSNSAMTVSGSNIVEWSYPSSTTGSQNWSFNPAPNDPGYFTLSNAASSGTTLGVAGAGAGASLQMQTPYQPSNSSYPQQEIALLPVTDGRGYYMLKDKGTAYCGDVSGGGTSNGTQILQWTCSSQSSPQGNQQWFLTPASPAIP